jgi:hypothetical protein
MVNKKLKQDLVRKTKEENDLFLDTYFHLVIQFLFESDAITEDTVFEWQDKIKKSNDETDKKLLKQCEGLLERLREVSSEEEEEEEEEQDSDVESDNNSDIDEKISDEDEEAEDEEEE